MPKDNLNALSEQVSNLAITMNEGETTLKKTIFAYMELRKNQSTEKIKNIDTEIANTKGGGIFGRLGDLFVALFNKKKSKTLAELGEATIGINNASVAKSNAPLDTSLSEEKSIRTKMRNAGYKSVAENIDSDSRSVESTKDDIQQG